VTEADESLKGEMTEAELDAARDWGANYWRGRLDHALRTANAMLAYTSGDLDEIMNCPADCDDPKAREIATRAEEARDAVHQAIASLMGTQNAA
jgi:hypothetical protein